jgi:FixJ family two-component response regulator
VAVSKCNIAIIEDNASFRRALERLLRASGFEVRTFVSAEEFLGCAEPVPYACIIVDIQLPGMSGFDLLDQLTTSCHALPVVLITADEQNTSSLETRASRIPKSRYLRKPFHGSVLLEAVRSLVEPGNSQVDNLPP